MFKRKGCRGRAGVVSPSFGVGTVSMEGRGEGGGWI